MEQETYQNKPYGKGERRYWVEARRDGGAPRVFVTRGPYEYMAMVRHAEAAVGERIEQVVETTKRSALAAWFAANPVGYGRGVGMPAPDAPPLEFAHFAGFSLHKVVGDMRDEKQVGDALSAEAAAFTRAMLEQGGHLS